MQRLPSLNSLRAFVAVARTRSVVAAADELCVTPSAVSHQLRRLEEELEVALFVRSGKTIALGPEGETYYEQLRDVFDRIEQATAKVRSKNMGRVVTITTVPVFAIKWLVRRLAQFHTLHPDIEVRLGTAYKSFDLNVSGHDLAIRWGAGHWPGMTAVRLMPDIVQPVCSPAFRNTHGLLSEASMEIHGRLIHMGRSRDDWRHWFDMSGWIYTDLPGSMHFSEPTSAIQAAIDGLGVVLGPHALVDEDLSSGRLVPAHGRTMLTHDAYYLVYPAKTAMSKAAAAFAHWVTGSCADFASTLAVPDLCLLPAR